MEINIPIPTKLVSPVAVAGDLLLCENGNLFVAQNPLIGDTHYIDLSIGTLVETVEGSPTAMLGETINKKYGMVLQIVKSDELAIEKKDFKYSVKDFKQIVDTPVIGVPPYAVEGVPYAWSKQPVGATTKVENDSLRRDEY